MAGKPKVQNKTSVAKSVVKCGACGGTGTTPSRPPLPVPPHTVIAAKAGMHRSTVTRILSNNPEQWRLRSALTKVRRVSRAMGMTVEQFMRHLNV